MEEIRRLSTVLFSDLLISNFGNAKKMTTDEVYNKAKTLGVNGVRNNLPKEKIREFIIRFQEEIGQ